MRLSGVQWALKGAQIELSSIGSMPKLDTSEIVGMPTAEIES